MFQRPPGRWIADVKDHLRELVIEGELSPGDKERARKIAAEYLNCAGKVGLRFWVVRGSGFGVGVRSLGFGVRSSGSGTSVPGYRLLTTGYSTTSAPAYRAPLRDSCNMHKNLRADWCVLHGESRRAGPYHEWSSGSSGQRDRNRTRRRPPTYEQRVSEDLGTRPSVCAALHTAFSTVCVLW